MVKIPRDYQEDAIGSFFDYFSKGNKGNPIISAATGAGKALILAELVKRIIQMYPQQRIVMATHVGDLVANNAKTFLGQYPNANLGIYSAGLKKKQPWCQIVYGGIQSMFRHADKLGHRDLLFIDEVHLLSPKDDGMYMKFIADLKRINPYLKVVGLSATPWRSKGGSLIKQKNAILTDIIYDISLGFLIKEGYLTPIAGKSSVIQADLSNVKKIGGEFNIGQMEKAFDVDELTKAAINEVELLAKDRKHFLFFTTGIQHARNVEAELKSRGWDCDVVIGSTPQTKRDKLLEKFKRTKTRYALINNTVLTTGTDLPNADCAVMLRGTQSSSLFIQMVGRLTRTMYADGYDLNTKQGRLDAIKYGQKPNALLLDYGGNVERFGAIDLIEAPFTYDKKKKNGDNDAPTAPPQKICFNCREAVPISTRECHCGYEFPQGERISHDVCATNLAVISSEIKPVEHNIVSVQYISHVSKNGNPCLRIQYYEMLGHVASEYLMFGSFGEPRRKAVEWFYNAVDTEYHDKLPTSTEAALAIKHLYKTPKKIVTKKVGRHLEVVDKIF